MKQNGDGMLLVVGVVGIAALALVLSKKGETLDTTEDLPQDLPQPGKPQTVLKTAGEPSLVMHKE
jgi:hypothetical protein